MMILGLLIGTIAATTPAARAAPPRPPVVVVTSAAPRSRDRTVCRVEFGATSLVQRVRICHAAAEWQRIDARRRARHTH